jgi:hypothetical protein
MGLQHAPSGCEVDGLDAPGFEVVRRDLSDAKISAGGSLLALHFVAHRTITSLRLASSARSPATRFGLRRALYSGR